MCHYNRCFTLVGDVDNGGDDVCVGTVVYEKSLNLLLRYAVDLQLLYKNVKTKE